MTTSNADPILPGMRQRLVSVVTRRYPFLSGCASFANSRLVRSAAGTGGGLAWARLECGMDALVPLDEYGGRAAYFVGDVDRKLSVIIKRIVRPGDTVLDIGANLGVVTLPLSRLVGDRGVVHSFEPNPMVRGLLLQSIARNDLKNVQVHECALGAEEGVTSLSYHDGNTGRGTLTGGHSRAGWKSVEVSVRTLSSVAEELDLSRVRLVKIDVEGYELEVLNGARRWLTSHPPDVILFESNDSTDADRTGGVLSLLSELGYALYSIPKILLLLRLKSYHADADGEETSHDMIAIRPECEREIVARFRA
jgi:FkbM family methyltransferase